MNGSHDRQKQGSNDRQKQAGSFLVSCLELEGSQVVGSFCHLNHSGNLEISQWLQIHSLWHLLTDIVKEFSGNGMAEAGSELGN